jgi:hypothetical protein
MGTAASGQTHQPPDPRSEASKMAWRERGYETFGIRSQAASERTPARTAMTTESGTRPAVPASSGGSPPRPGIGASADPAIDRQPRRAPRQTVLPPSAPAPRPARAQRVRRAACRLARGTSPRLVARLPGGRTAGRARDLARSEPAATAPATPARARRRCTIGTASRREWQSSQSRAWSTRCS